MEHALPSDDATTAAITTISPLWCGLVCCNCRKGDLKPYDGHFCRTLKQFFCDFCVINEHSLYCGDEVLNMIPKVPQQQRQPNNQYCAPHRHYFQHLQDSQIPGKATLYCRQCAKTVPVTLQ